MNEMIKVLVIEDDIVDLKIIKRALDKTGMNLEKFYAESLKDAQEIVLNENVDCIFLDYILPDGDGLEFLKNFRLNDETTPVIVVTSHGDERIAVDAIKSGATDYMTKNLFSPEGLGLALRNAVRWNEFQTLKIAQEKEIEQTSRRLKEAQILAGLGSWEYDVLKGDMKCSDEVYRILGLNLQDELPSYKGYLDMVHKEDSKKLKDKIYEAIHHAVPYLIEIRHVRPDNSITTCISKGLPVLNDKGEVTSLLGTFLDITERKKHEEAIVLAKQEAERLAKVKEDFLANMSHEIRTPMNAIIGFSGILMKTDLDDKQAGYLNSINASAEHLLDIINDILDYSKIESGMLLIKEQELDLCDLLNSLNSTFKMVASEKEIDFQTEIEKNTPNLILGDGFRLNQILFNLIGNAVKFTDDGHVNLKVSSEVNGKKALLKFVVEDTGVGIPEDFLPTLFDSFTQANNNSISKYGGTGLGLSIVQKLVELQDGTLTVDSMIGKGSTFTVEIPYVILSKEELILPIIENQSVEEKDLNGVQILLAEDNIFNQKLAVKILTDLKAHVTVANNGLEAIENVKKNNFDIILMDIRMPEMNGVDAASFIISELNCPTPIMALTAQVLPDEKENCLSVGMKGFLTKPFRNEELLEGILTLVSKKKIDSKELINEEENDSNETPESLVLDFSMLVESTEGDVEFMKMMLGIFIDETPKEINILETHLKNENWQGIKDSVHKMKAQSRIVGAMSVFDMMNSIEHRVINKEPMDSVPNDVTEILGLLPFVVKACQEKMDSL